jgi:biotin carboxyl carrier protein
MNSTIIKEKIKTIDKKVLYGASMLAAFAMLAAGYALVGKDKSYASVPKAETAISVTTLTVKPRSIDAMISAAGTLNSKNTSVLSSKVMGRVVALTVTEGDYVTRGKLLIRIESNEISAQAYQAQAAYNNAKLQYSRIKSLFDEKAATQMEMEQATLGFESAKAGLNAARAMESYTTITAPISGQIMEKRINLGEMALPGQPILKIEDNKNLRLEATVKEQDIRLGSRQSRDCTDRCPARQRDQRACGAGGACSRYQDTLLCCEDRHPGGQEPDHRYVRQGLIQRRQARRHPGPEDRDRGFVGHHGGYRVLGRYRRSRWSSSARTEATALKDDGSEGRDIVGQAGRQIDGRHCSWRRMK